MSETCSEHETPAEREAQGDYGVLSLMLCDEPLWSYPWTIEEIGREIRDPTYAVDAVARLTMAGLVHRMGEFVFPTRAARRADELSQHR